MTTVTPFEKPVPPRFSDVPDSMPGPEERLAYQAIGRTAPQAATRRTDKHGRPLSIFMAHRRGRRSRTTTAPLPESESAVGAGHET
jgi:hypothetical protein